ncbi:TIR domain-containing protein [Polymorphobacter sp. PAMC 29334]|uniref:TIR domain-containing protein n=1 Tax=Polymorphobacter sp. PAMC 29334 TaxID=2862331 RepID=UPI001C765A7B|nr:TIR domain-containing protein [Polymorphobacter sp. PAMC 29334]QYE33800.1 TIR domain-containing protein [Polymorphobacter sp. PAMC 29334]
MVDLFVSYKSQDRARLKPLVDALEADGIAIWWDAHIGGGDAWREAIEQNLNAARCVLVVWSKGSTGAEGHFVRDEATRAQRRNAYLPVLIDPVEPPLGFGEIQALSLIGWKGDRADPQYHALLTAVRAILDGKRLPASVKLGGRPRAGMDRRLALAGGGLAALLAAGAGGWALWPRAEAKDASIAVMPFANLSGDPTQAYFADGIAEELRSALTRIPQFTVIGRNSSEAARNEDTRTAAAKLGVASILTGSVRRSPSMIRISAQLVSGKDGVEHWSESYDRAPGDSLEIQSAIAQSVAQALQIRLLPQEKDLLSVGGTRNAKAHDLLLRAFDATRSDDTDESYTRALALVDSALQLDAHYGEALAHRARMIGLLAQNAPTAEEVQQGMQRAIEAGRIAVSEAPKLASAYSGLAQGLKGALDLREARRTYEQGVAVGGGSESLRGQAQLLSGVGEFDAALRAIELATKLDPLFRTNLTIQASVLYYGRRYAEALDAGLKSTVLFPKMFYGKTVAGDSLNMLGRYREALVQYGRLPNLHFSRLTGEAIALAKLGDLPGSDARLKSLDDTYKDSIIYQFAQIRSQRGVVDLACTMLEKALALRDAGLTVIFADPYLDPIRREARFQAVVKALGPTR